MILSLPPAAVDSLRPARPVRLTLMPPAPDRGSVPAWHFGADLLPLRPLPADLAASLTARAQRTRARPLALPAAAAPQPVPAAPQVRRRVDLTALALAAMIVALLGGTLGVMAAAATHGQRPARPVAVFVR